MACGFSLIACTFSRFPDHKEYNIRCEDKNKPKYVRAVQDLQFADLVSFLVYLYL